MNWLVQAVLPLTVTIKIVTAAMSGCFGVLLDLYHLICIQFLQQPSEVVGLAWWCRW